jgi:hypothetical protein
MHEWNKMSQKGLRFALKISTDIIVVQVRASDKKDELKERWTDLVEAPECLPPLPRLMRQHGSSLSVSIGSPKAPVVISSEGSYWLVACFRIQSPMVFKATGAKVSSIFPYSLGDPVSLV